MRSFTHRAWLVALAGLLTGPAFAQQSQQPQVPNQGQATQATRQGAQTAFPNGITNPLYTNQDVRQALNLSDDQLRRLNAANAALQDQYRTDFSGLSGVPEQDRAARLQELTRRYNTAFNQSAADIINRDQMRRYQQLGLQYRGYDAFGDADIQRQLNLSADQQQQLRLLQQRYGQDLRDISRYAQTNREDAMRRYQALQRQSGQQLNTILNDQQRQAWSGMTGEPFPFQPQWTPGGP